MPPKQKGAAATKAKAKAAATTPRATRTSVPDTVTSSRGKDYETTAALSRPRRESAVLQSPAELKKASTAATPSRKRGRLAKEVAEEVEEEVEDDSEDEPEPPKKRGRPAKKAAEPVKQRGPGRPAKKIAEDTNEQEEMADEPVPDPRPRGRPPKKGAAKAPIKAAPKAAKKRGRPSKTDVAAAAADAANGEAEESFEEDGPSPKKRGPGQPAKKLKGNGKNKGAGGEASLLQEDVADEDGEEAIDEVYLEQTASDRQYWLMKAEQEDREEELANGQVFNTKFTIDDLKSKDVPEPWDGVRNPTAAKNMRAMKKGDLAFFYASGGKSGRKPGITGIMEIVKEHELDKTTSDEGAYGYVKDEKARGKWCVVHVEYRNKLSKPVHLSELQKYVESGRVLSKMQVLKQSRLSVTSVSADEWDFITENLIEGFEDEDALPGAEGVNGTSNHEEESALITTEQPDGGIVVNESTQPEQDLPPDNVPLEPVLATADSEIPSTDTIFLAETSQTSRPASRGGSRAPLVKANTNTSRQSSRAGSVAAGGLAVPATNGRGRSRTPRGRAGSAAPVNGVKGEGTAGMPAIGEDDE